MHFISPSRQHSAPSLAAPPMARSYSAAALLCIACNIVSVGSLRVAHHVGAVAHGQPARHTLRSSAAFCCADAGRATGWVRDEPDEAPDDISNENILRIVLSETTDEETNALVWKYLGYRYDEETGAWDASAVFPKWAKKYPQPPDLIGVTRTYERAVDEPVLRAVQALQRSVPTEHKDNLRQELRPLGWAGFKMAGLTPNMTRRAQVASWLLYYRTELHGVPIDELRRRRAARAAAEAAAPEKQAPTGMAGQSVV